MNNEPRVLIVESNDILRVMLFTVLRHQPVSVDTAVSAQDALRKVTSCDYALVLVDADMSDAVEFLTTFRAERPEATSFIIAVRDGRSDTFLDAEVVVAVKDVEGGRLARHQESAEC